MPKKSVVHFLILFYAMFFWGIGGGRCSFGDNETAFSRSVSTLSPTTDDGNNRPADHNTVGNFSVASLPSACLSGGTNGSRQLSSTQGRLVLLVRLLGGNAYVMRGGFGRIDEIRCQYGLVRPHLYFCRLLI